MTDKTGSTTNPPEATKKLVTVAVIAIGLILVWLAYTIFVNRPWTRDGRVRADIVDVATEVSGKIIAVHVQDEQLVQIGDPLFEVDPASYKIAVEHARVGLDEARQQVASLTAAVDAARAEVEVARSNTNTAKAQVDASKANLKLAEAEAQRYQRLSKSGAGSTETAQKSAAQLLEARADLIISEARVGQAESSLASAEAGLEQAVATLGAAGDDNVRVRAAKVALADAELNLERTRVLAPRTGWVTNLFLQPGDYAHPGAAMMTLVDKDSLRIAGFFKETQIYHIRPGDRAIITLMGYDEELDGVVENIGSAIDPPQLASVEGSSAMVPSVAPSYDWIRLAQRVPVRIRLTSVPEDVKLVSGATASVAIRPAQ
jgi:multidrug resistance efflux pump